MRLNNKKSKPIKFTRSDLRDFAEQIADCSSLVFSRAKQHPYLVLNALDGKLGLRLRRALRKAYSKAAPDFKPTFGSSLPEEGIALVLGGLTAKPGRCSSCGEPWRLLYSGPMGWYKGRRDITEPIRRVLARGDRTLTEVPVCPSCGRADETREPKPDPAVAALERLAEAEAVVARHDAPRATATPLASTASGAVDGATMPRQAHQSLVAQSSPLTALTGLLPERFVEDLDDL